MVFLSLKKKNSFQYREHKRNSSRCFYRAIFVQRILWKSFSPFRHTLATTIMNYSAACESARCLSPRKTLANPRVSRNSPPPHLGNPPLAQHTLREMRCVLHLNAGHLELSGCVPSFFRTSFTISRSGKLRRGSFLSWSEHFSKCGEILFTREYNSFRIIVLLMEIKGWWRF